MATTKLALEIIAKNRAKKELAGFQTSLKATTTAMKRFGMAALSMVGIASVGLALKSVTAAYLVQETAVADLTAALRNNADQSGITVKDLERYAAEMQKATIYGDELILSQMAYATNLGVTTDKLKAATKAAVGLAAKYRLDLQSAMMLVGRASMGQTQMLTRFGIVLEESLTPLEKFNALLKLGADSFHLAEAVAKTSAGQFAQFQLTVGDLKEELGKGLIPALLATVKGMNAVGRAAKSLVPTSTGTSFDRLQALPQSQQDAVMKVYRQRLQEAAQARMPSGYTASRNRWREDIPLLLKLIAAYERSGEVQTRFWSDQAKRKTAAQIPEAKKISAEAQKIIDANNKIISSQRARMLSLIQQIDTEIELLGRVDEPRQHARMMVEFQASAAELYGSNIAEATRETELFRLKLEELGRAQRLQVIADGIGDSFGRAFEEMAFGAGKASEAIRALADDVLRLMYRQIVTAPLSEAFSDLFTGFFTPTATIPSMTDATGPHTFAAGGVFDRPTLGVFGEAGPETILPLTRGPGGKLGVSASGSTDLNVSLVNQTGIPMRSEILRVSDRDVVVGLIMEDFEAGGATADMFGGG